MPSGHYGDRPKYTPEIVAEILARLSEGETLLGICKDEHMPSSSAVRKWARERVEFSAVYARARDDGLDSRADQLLEIAGTPRQAERVVEEYDDAGNLTARKVTVGDAVERDRLHVDSLKWYLSKLAPKRYGERLDARISGADGGPVLTADVTDVELARHLAFYLARVAHAQEAGMIEGEATKIEESAE